MMLIRFSYVLIYETQLPKKYDQYYFFFSIMKYSESLVFQDTFPLYLTKNVNLKIQDTNYPTKPVDFKPTLQCKKISLPI